VSGNNLSGAARGGNAAALAFAERRIGGFANSKVFNKIAYFGINALYYDDLAYLLGGVDKTSLKTKVP
jgi:hypothetical protein